ncbi:TetR/AcrR family transcriptional regulator [Kibdelosporangium philippinense]|uniref:TetR/AcrR family transcriptional regulator n=1 Tax=Kibdelosporangium philippinense TaxID=211113 RepID=A0ABS8ZC82_9PSEU|nr:TetR/AcrR family transcriptional regulator [Kibdelosporangium philippinense]MCE7004450.1 TetR/AcrR family transcriptional regulator [Kibdelosporangium philippinense]
MTTGSVSPRRADTRRNNERIIAAAKDSLTCSGEVSYNAIAKKAEVGVGTVYRHFPTPESLILAVYQREVRNLVEVVPDLLKDNPPDQAFRQWMWHLAGYLMTKRGLASAMQAARTSPEDLPAKSFTSILDALTTMLDANVAAGTIRPGLEPLTVMRAFGGLMFLDPDGDWEDATHQLFDLLWQGMRAT